MSKILVLAASLAVVLGSVAITSGADARHVKQYVSRGFHGHSGYALKRHASRQFHRYYGYTARYPRRFYQSPPYAPNMPPPRNYNNPGVPDFQLGSRG
jgi:hypothetical protein